jgi:sec-independent protein translocase protein TatA
MLNGLQPWHLIILVLFVVLMFGAKRLPDAARSVGKSMKIFRAETKDMKSDDKDKDDAEDAETKSLPSAQSSNTSSSNTASSGTSPNNDQQVADLQRQLDELKKQQSSTPADQAHKNAS